MTETTEIKVGDSLHLRIHPGGGDSLAGAREALRNAREMLPRAGRLRFGVRCEGGRNGGAQVRPAILRAGRAAALAEQDADALTEPCAWPRRNSRPLWRAWRHKEQVAERRSRPTGPGQDMVRSRADGPSVRRIH